MRRQNAILFHVHMQKVILNRVNDAVYDLIMNYNEITRDVIENQSEKYMVCPFEMSLDVSLWVDAVICDYNYVFDPTAHLKRFFFSENAGKIYFSCR